MRRASARCFRAEFAGVGVVGGAEDCGGADEPCVGVQDGGVHGGRGGFQLFHPSCQLLDLRRLERDQLQ